MTFNFSTVDSSWLPLIQNALNEVSSDYKRSLLQDPNWLPGPDAVFNAFSLPLAQLKVILFGESPYPRAISANGYAFYDASVDHLWSKTGLSKAVNRATSLRNIIKMLLVAEGALSADDLSQTAIAALDKSLFIQTLPELFQRLQEKGFLLLNASLVLSSKPVQIDIKAWQPFMAKLLALIFEKAPQTELLLWGRLAQMIDHFPQSHRFKRHYAEHPYNLSFIHNPEILAYFRPLHLLNRHQHA
ncbi:MAG: uracil-DNA glycosylase [Gammaproteobacteria bacterium]|nr:uracil-DNA glycosylase [Gammaproteobacteria bacterium]